MANTMMSGTGEAAVLHFEIESVVITEICKLLAVKKSRITPYHHQSCEAIKPDISLRAVYCSYWVAIPLWGPLLTFVGYVFIVYSGFHPENKTFTAYFKRMQMFFAANSVAEKKQVAALLSIIGAKTYVLRTDFDPKLLLRCFAFTTGARLSESQLQPNCEGCQYTVNLVCTLKKPFEIDLYADYEVRVRRNDYF